jgi:L-serine dehydratase
MVFLFESFEEWKKYSDEKNMSLPDVVLEYERTQRNRTDDQIRAGLAHAWDVMKDAVRTGLEEEMVSRSGMVNNGAKKVYNYPTPVLSKEFQLLISRALSAKEVNSCMGRVVAAPTAGQVVSCREFWLHFRRFIRSMTKKLLRLCCWPRA